ncbi:MAG: rhodanese-like domain-containing protein, partial [Eudoraea sp.]|nr:rhodanese-like domain-containing protein [Eudoraea sp.]
DVQLVDVRTQREFRSGHIGKAMNIDFFKGGEFIKAFEDFDKQKPLYLYCRSGNRSQKAARKLVSLGFEKIYDLKGGILRWE